MKKPNFLPLQKEVVFISFLLMEVQKKIVAFELKQFFVLEDSFFYESLSNLINMVEISQKDLDTFTSDLQQLKKSILPFSWDDLLNKWNYIKTNVLLENEYFSIFLGSVQSYLHIFYKKNNNSQNEFHDLEKMGVLFSQMEWNNLKINQNFVEEEVDEKDALRN